MRPLRVYLLILVLGAMLPGAMLTGALVWRAFDNNRTAGARRLVESARVDAAALDRTFESTIRTLEALATSPTLDLDDLEPFYQEGRRVQATQAGWYTIVLLALDGRQLVNTRLPWGKPLIQVVEPDSLRRLIATRQPVVGLISNEPYGAPEHLIPIRVPVARNGSLKYALSAIVNVKALAQVVPPQLPNSEEWTRSILDPDGIIAVRTRGAENYVGTQAPEGFRRHIDESSETVSSEVTQEGVAVYVAVSRGKYGWSTAVVVPRNLLDAPLRASMTGVLAGGAVLMICGLAAVLRVSRRLSSDITAATSAADAVAAGRPLPGADSHVAETLRLQQSLATAASLLDKRAHERDEEMRRADAAREEAEEANRTKDQFLAVLGHELRNPLAPALTALELMKMRDANVFKREREVLERQVAHMVRLVNDLLDVSRLARGKAQLDRRRFEVREAVDRAVDMARPLITGQRHMLLVAVPATGLAIYGDIDRIVQVLSNLLTNAAKYTPAGGEIALTASASGDAVIIVCEDNGPGVPADLVPRLFDTFAQGPRALDRKEGGLGLGLALARTFTELHGGTIRLDSRGAEGGSRFIITLPLAPAAAAEAPMQPAEPAVHSIAQRILLVDDNADASEMLGVALQRAGHVLAIADSGPNAIAMAETFRPDVGVLDVGLPGMNGYELAQRLSAAHPGIRLIAVTGYGQAADLEAAAAAGFESHCVKPITIEALLDRIDGRSTV